MFAVYFAHYKKYGKFGSYSAVRLYDDPAKASLYSRIEDARRRVQQHGSRHVIYHGPGSEKVQSKWGSSMAPEAIGPMEIHKIAFSFTAERVE